jgi:hypothetical protein
MLPEVSLLAPVHEEHKPARAPVLQHEGLVGTFTVERDQFETATAGKDLPEPSSGQWLRHIDMIPTAASDRPKRPTRCATDESTCTPDSPTEMYRELRKLLPQP